MLFCCASVFDTSVELVGVRRYVEVDGAVVSEVEEEADEVAEEDMSGETEIEVSVVSEEDVDLEGSRSSSSPTDMLLQEKSGKGGCGLGNSFSFDVGKVALRPACNAQYTSFSIESILGHPESPTADATSAVSIADRQSSDQERSSPPIPAAATSQRILLSCGSSPSDTLMSPTSIRSTSGARNSNTNSSSTNNHHSIDGGRNNPSGGVGCATSATSPASYTSGDPANPLMGHQASADLAVLSR